MFKSLNVNIPVLDMLLDSPDRIKQTLARYMNLGVHIKKNERLNHILLNTNKTNETGRIVLRRGGDKIWHANKPDDINVISEVFSRILFIL